MHVIRPGAVTATVTAGDPGCGMRFLLGAYVLGGLPEWEETAVEAHLSSCVRCQAECEDLACVPGWLDLLGGEIEPADGVTGE